MSEFEKQANETIMGLPQSGGSVTTTTTNTSNTTNITSTSAKRGTKRSWDEDQSASAESDPQQQDDHPSPPTKLQCTSPPHALCAEDVPQHSSQHLPAMISGSSDHACTNASFIKKEDSPLLSESSTLDDCEMEAEEDRDLLDEEDKDSGFIDSNSADNSSDDDMDVRLSSTATSSSVASSTVTSSECVTSFVGSTSGSSISSSLHDCSNVPSSSSSVVLPSCSSAFSSISSSYLTMENSSVVSDNDFNNPELSSVDCTAADSISSINNSYNITCCSDVVSTSAASLSTSIALSIDILNCSNSGSNTSCNSSISCLNSLSSSPCERVQNNLALPSTSDTLSSLQEFSSPSLPQESALVSSPLPSASGESTVTTSAYPGTVATPSYDPNIYPPAFSSDFRPPLSSSPHPNGGVLSGSWSCNFYDANQPTNKYMEIQTSKTGPPNTLTAATGAGLPPSTSQPIQCDANGKSYMELGSSSPYTQTFSNECGSYTTSPSSTFSNGVFNNNSYNNSNNYSPPSPQQAQPNSANPYYRPNYPQYNYPNGENFPSNYESSDGCSYSSPSPGYPNAGGVSVPYSPARGSKLRCVSPFCDPSRSSQRTPCYQQQRLSVLNMSMCKLNRFSRFPDPSLHKSVLICNTLRLIERELENEGTSMNALLTQQHMMQPPHCPPPTPPPPPSGVLSEGPLPPMQPPLLSGGGPSSPLMPPPIAPPYNNGSPLQYHHYGESNTNSYEDLRLYSPPGEASDGDALSIAPVSALSISPSCEGLPFSPPNSSGGSSVPVTNSSINGTNKTLNNNVTSVSNNNTVCNINSSNSSINSSSSTTSVSTGSDERPDGSIDWCSVLSLPSQSELDSLNNSEFCEWSSSDLDYSSNSTTVTTTTGISTNQHHYQSVASTPPPSSASNLMLISPRTVSTEGDSPGTGATGPWKLPSLSAEDILRSFPDSNRRAEQTADEFDSLINVAVES